MKKITLAILIHNRFQFVEQALISIFNQSYKNYEVIVIQNSPTQEVIKTIEYLSEKYEFRTYVLDSNNISVARNFAITKSRGDYLAFLDDDDVIDIDNLASRISRAVESDADLLISNYYFMDHSGARLNFVTDLDCLDDSVLKEKINYHNVFSGIINGFFKLSSFGNFASFDENLMVCEDHDIFRSWNNSGAKIEFIYAKIAGYRLHNQGITKNTLSMISGELAHLSKIIKGDNLDTSVVVNYFKRLEQDYRIYNNLWSLDKKLISDLKINNLKSIDTILYINLDRSKDRKDAFEKQALECTIEDYTRISGIDATVDDYQGLISGAPPPNLTPSEICCSLSHLKAINYFVNNTKHKRILICEDDVDFSIAAYWNFNWSEINENLPENWGVIQLSVITDPGESFLMGMQRREYNFYSTGAYLISREYAIKILKTYMKDGKFNLNRKLPGIDQNCTAENVVYSGRGVFTLPIFLYKTNFDSLIHNDHVNSVHEPNRLSQLDWWKSLKNKGIESFFKPTEKNVIVSIGKVTSYSIALLEHDGDVVKSSHERHADKIAKLLETKIKTALAILFGIKIAHNLLYNLYLIIIFLKKKMKDLLRLDLSTLFKVK